MSIVDLEVRWRIVASVASGWLETLSQLFSVTIAGLVAKRKNAVNVVNGSHDHLPLITDPLPSTFQ